MFVANFKTRGFAFSFCAPATISMVFIDIIPIAVAAEFIYIYFIRHTAIFLDDYRKCCHMMFRTAHRCTILDRMHPRCRTINSYRNTFFLSLPYDYLNLIMKTSLFNHSSGHMPFCGFPMEMLSIFFSTTWRSLV